MVPAQCATGTSTANAGRTAGHLAGHAGAVVLRLVTDQAVARSVRPAADLALEMLRHIEVPIGHVPLQRPSARERLVAHRAHFGGVRGDGGRRRTRARSRRRERGRRCRCGERVQRVKVALVLVAVGGDGGIGEREPVGAVEDVAVQIVAILIGVVYVDVVVVMVRMARMFDIVFVVIVVVVVVVVVFYVVAIVIEVIGTDQNGNGVGCLTGKVQSARIAKGGGVGGRGTIGSRPGLRCCGDNGGGDLSVGLCQRRDRGGCCRCRRRRRRCRRALGICK